jgi:hypothetical protein
LGAQRCEPPLITRRGIVSSGRISGDLARGLRDAARALDLVRVRGEVDGEAHSGDIAHGDDQETGERSSASQTGADLRILQRLVALGLHLGAALAGDPDQGGVSEDRTERAGHHDELEVEVSSCGSVEAALSVVSPGKTGMTASNQTNRQVKT